MSGGVFMDAIERIKEKIIQDETNEEYTKMGYQPIFMASEHAKILIIGQAPGKMTQEKGEVFRDKSGDTLRRWLGMDEKVFYESGLLSVLPMDFYFPGKGTHGDLPPRKEFASMWHPQLLKAMPNIQLTILIGTYAQAYYLNNRMKKNLTETIRAYKSYLPAYFVLAHPSPLNFRWFKKNSFFEEDVIVTLQALVKQILHDDITVKDFSSTYVYTEKSILY